MEDRRSRWRLSANKGLATFIQLGTSFVRALVSGDKLRGTRTLTADQGIFCAVHARAKNRF
nr:MAG TPA: hypothetical protein [Caudoviricetes sp.]